MSSSSPHIEVPSELTYSGIELAPTEYVSPDLVAMMSAIGSVV